LFVPLKLIDFASVLNNKLTLYDVSSSWNTSTFLLSQYLLTSLALPLALCAVSKPSPAEKLFLEKTLPILDVKSSAFCFTLTAFSAPTSDDSI
jgi:hypothetical protein